MYALLGGYVLLGCSVAGMAWAMYLRGDAGGGLAQVLVATIGVGVLAAAAAVGLYRPLLVAGRGPVASERPAPTVDGVPAVPQPGAGVRELAGRGT